MCSFMSRSHSPLFRTLKLILHTSTVIYYKCRKVTKPTVLLFCFPLLFLLFLFSFITTIFLLCVCIFLLFLILFYFIIIFILHFTHKSFQYSIFVLSKLIFLFYLFPLLLFLCSFLIWLCCRFVFLVILNFLDRRSLNKWLSKKVNGFLSFFQFTRSGPKKLIYGIRNIFSNRFPQGLT